MFKNKFYKSLNYVTNITKTPKKVNEPVFWLFLDEHRIPDYEKMIRFLPKCHNNKLGVVFRNLDKRDLYKKYKLLARLCKLKKVPFLISDNPELAKILGARGVHFSKKTKNAKKYSRLLYSCSFHGLSDVRRTKSLSVDLVFISPIFKTNSSLTKKPLGLLISGLLSNYLNCKKANMGGLNLQNIRLLKSRRISCLGGLEYFYNLIK